MAAEAQPGELLERVQRLTEELEKLGDVRAQELAQELLATVIAMYGDGLRRIVETIEASREAGASILDQLSQDGPVASLLLIHDLYPVPLHERVLEALDTVRPYMESHGGNVELLGVEAGVARLALQGSCNGCAASRATLELAIKQALEEHAPDLAGLEVEGVSDPAPTTRVPRSPGPLSAPSGADGGGFELPMVHSEPPPATVEPRPARWIALDVDGGLDPESIRSLSVEGADLLLARVNGSLLAYRNACASCGEPLHGGELAGSMLRCSSCGVEFDLPRAGRAAGGEPLQLTPVPLLESGGVRVAV